MCRNPHQIVIQGFSVNVQDAETRKHSAGPPEFLASTQASGGKEHYIISDAQSAPTLGQNNLEAMAIDLKFFAFPYEWQESIRQEHRKAEKLRTEALTIGETF